MHYVELRRHDIRHLQHRLGQLGLSSLGRSEAHVLATVDAVLEVLDSLVGNARTPDTSASVGFGEGDFLLAANAADLLGPQAPGRAARIMVTLPSEATHEPDLVDALVDAGMDIARINSAHDRAEDWLAMITNLRSESDVDPPLVAMDLAGPKLRTGTLSPGPAVVRARPQRDPYGHVITPARIWLTGPPAVVPGRNIGGKPPDARARRCGSAIARQRPELVAATTPRRRDRGDRCPGLTPAMDRLRDRRGGVPALVHQNDLLRERPRVDVLRRVLRRRRPGLGDPAERPVTSVMTGDRIVLARDLDGPLVSPADVDPSRRGTTVAVGCTLPELFGAARPGQPVWLDDGKIGGVVGSRRAADRLRARRHRRAARRRANLKSGQGDQRCPTPTSWRSTPSPRQDLHDLPVVAAPCRSSSTCRSCGKLPTCTGCARNSRLAAPTASASC